MLTVILVAQGDWCYDQLGEANHEHEHIVLSHVCSPFFLDVVCICIRTTSLLFERATELTYLLNLL